MEIHLPRKAYCILCTDTATYGTDTVNYGTDAVSCGSSGKKGPPGLCSVLPPASDVDVLCCTAVRTVLSALSHTLYNQDHLQWTTSGTLLICHCLQCNQSCHQFVAKHTLMSFIADLGYFVSWCNYNDQTCFSPLDTVISELLTTATAQVDKHIWPERKVIFCANFVVYVMSIECLDIDLCLSLVCSSGRKSLKHTVKSILWVAFWNRIKCQKKCVFHTLDLDNAFSFRGLRPLT